MGDPVPGSRGETHGYRWLATFKIAGAVALAAAPAHADDAGKIRDAQRGFSFTVPAGYQASAGSVGGRTYHAFTRGQPGEPSYAVFRLTGLGGTIGRDELDHSAVENAARSSVKGTGVELTRFEYRKTPWRTFDLDLVLAHATNGEQRLLTLGVQVPLEREALQLELMGPASSEPLLLSDLQVVLTSLDGKTSWLDDSERSERLGRVIGGGIGLVIALPLAFAWRRRRRRSRRRSVAAG